MLSLKNQAFLRKTKKILKDDHEKKTLNTFKPTSNQSPSDRDWKSESEQLSWLPPKFHRALRFFNVFFTWFVSRGQPGSARNRQTPFSMWRHVTGRDVCSTVFFHLAWLFIFDIWAQYGQETLFCGLETNPTLAWASKKAPWPQG